MTTTLVLTEDIARQLHGAASDSVEHAGVLLAAPVVTTQEDYRLLARELHWVPQAAYLAQESDHLCIASDGYVPSLARAEVLSSVAIWVHTHPGHAADPRPSDHDRLVDAQLSDVFRLRANTKYYASAIFSAEGSSLNFSGKVSFEDGSEFPIDRLWLVGSRLQLVRPFGSPRLGLSPAFDRNVRAFGTAIQCTLADLRVGIVGCGGTGSAVAEQLVRLGVRDLRLIDGDVLSESNVTRVYGSSPSNVTHPKVEALSVHLMKIAPDLNCRATQSMVTVEATARTLIDRDVVFGCTDDNAGRLVLSRIATYLIVPVFDCGVLLSSDADGQLLGIDGRVTVLHPGTACLVCRDRIDLRRASSELLTPEERNRREDEGYAPALGRAEPAVITYTSMVAATAVSELLERLIGYGQSPRPTEILLRLHEREVSTNAAQPRTGHYCDPSYGKLGTGITQPFLDQVWPA